MKVLNYNLSHYWLHNAVSYIKSVPEALKNWFSEVCKLFPPNFLENFQQPSLIPPFIEKDTSKVSSNLVIIQKDVEK